MRKFLEFLQNVFISKKLFLLFQNVTKIVFSKFHEFLKNEKLCVFIVMVHKICQKFYKSALFPQNNALLFSKIVRFLAKKEKKFVRKRKFQNLLFYNMIRLNQIWIWLINCAQRISKIQKAVYMSFVLAQYTIH